MTEDKQKFPKVRAIESIAHSLRDLFYTKSTVVLIGQKQILILALHKGTILETISITLQEANISPKLEQFFLKYRKFYIFFLLDTKESILEHESIPTLNSLVTEGNIANFIKSKFTDNDIVGYHVYDFESNGDILKVLFASTPYQTNLSTIFEYILEKNIYFGGMYFLATEFNAIVDQILIRINQVAHQDDLQIFITLTQSSGIKVAVKHNTNLISLKTIEYPENASNEYIQGILEQACTDAATSVTTYIKNNKLSVCIIMLLNQDIVNLLEKSNFTEHKVILVKHSDISNQNENTFSDDIIAKYFLKYKHNPATGAQVKQIAKLHLLDFILFKPALIILIIMLFSIINMKYQSYKNKTTELKLQQEYYALTEQYRKVRYNKYSDLPINFSHLNSLSTLDKVINQNHELPFTVIEQVIRALNSQIMVTNIHWNNKSTRIKIKFTDKTNRTKEKAIIAINQYVNNLNKLLSGYKASSIIDDNNYMIIGDDIKIEAVIEIEKI